MLFCEEDEMRQFDLRETYRVHRRTEKCRKIWVITEELARLRH